MYDVVEIATSIVISEWHTKEEAQEQVDRFNKSANGEYYKVEICKKDDMTCDDLNQDGTCNYAKEKFNKILHCNSVTCSRKYANEYKQKYENLLKRITHICLTKEDSEERIQFVGEGRVMLRNTIKTSMLNQVFEEVKKHIRFKEITKDNNIKFTMELKVLNDENQN